MRRIVSLWFPHWPTDAWRWRRREPGGDGHQRPFALAERSKGGQRLSGVDAAAAAAGLRPGMPLADARALVPQLTLAPAEPAAAAAALGRLAGWCGRWTPWTATDGSDGIALNVTGCAHLFAGEAALLDQMRDRLQRLGFTVRLALADTLGAAWAWARYGAGGALAPGAQATVLGPLPVAALRLPAALVRELERLGLGTVAALAAIPRAPLAARFGETPLRRLDQALGHQDEPVGPRPPAVDWTWRRAFAEPIGRREDVEAGLRRLLDDLATGLANAGRGARRLTLTLYRIDGSTQGFTIGTARPGREPGHLSRLFAEPLAGFDPGFGIEAMVLTAPVTEPLPERQRDWQSADAQPDALVRLIDGLQQRLGAAAVVRLAAVESHWPERAVTVIPALAPPEPVEVTVAAPDQPPLAFRWRQRHCRITRSEGPERIQPEWWRPPADGRERDYYWIEDADGRRYWMFRAVSPPPDRPACWYIHGFFP